ncbi:hypothetical protein PTE30175_03181 [Pandoraea terrae]|uniref:Uncharacterized protein n=1 Tax=Pandoraea terrae TaxID=1537710 RepID=A0A5E4WEL5_9BURK|nr:hypothetical protein PTE30175_03181 [Pandoraea terrae]
MCLQRQQGGTFRATPKGAAKSKGLEAKGDALCATQKRGFIKQSLEIRQITVKNGIYPILAANPGVSVCLRIGVAVRTTTFRGVKNRQTCS